MTFNKVIKMKTNFTVQDFENVVVIPNEETLRFGSCGHKIKRTHTPK